MWIGVSMIAMGFVTSTPEQICGKDTSSYSYFINVSRELNNFHPATADNYVRFLLCSPDVECCKFFSGIIINWVKGTSEKFLKTAAGLPDSEKLFQRELYQNKKTSTKKIDGAV